MESIFCDEIGRIGLQHAYSRHNGLISGVEFDTLMLFSNYYLMCLDGFVGLNLLVLCGFGFVMLHVNVVFYLICCVNGFIAQFSHILMNFLFIDSIYEKYIVIDNVIGCGN